MRIYMMALAGVCCVFGMRAHAAQGVFKTETADGRVVTVTVVNDDVIKVSNAPVGVEVPASASVVLQPEDFTGKVINAGNSKVITTDGGVTVMFNQQSGAVTISAGNNRVLVDNGVRGEVAGRQEMALTTTGVGSFYGAGERGHSIDLAGDTLVMYNKQNYGYKGYEERINQMNISIPLFISSEGYGVLFDDYAAAEMIMGNPVKYITEGKAPVSYYFINGAGSLEGVVEAYTELTGRQELPPFWSLGYITSKYGYKTEAETRGIIDSLKLGGYPVDGVVLDLYWYGKEEDMGRLAWEPSQWPTYREMLADFKKDGVNTIIISQPYVLKNGRAIDNYNTLSPQGMFCRDSVGNTHDVTIWVGTGGMFDVSNPLTRQWLRDRYKLLTDEGVGGWWGDLGEPEVHPETIFHHNGLTAREYHNQYGNDWSRIIYDLYKEEYPDTRLMTLMRGGTAGLQRYSVFPWSTDVSRSWGGLQPQIKIMINAGLSGLGYMSHDVGGFAMETPEFANPELYVRWLQLGLFSPILRTHAQEVAEPFRYTEHQDIILPLIKERYRWLPYNYTLAAENAMKGLPLVRPMNFYSLESNKYDAIADQYLWGRDVMVAPVLTQGATSRQVVFPEGMWVDYNNPANVYAGGDTISYAAPLEVLPLFVRAGAFIPQADYEMENTGDYVTNRYMVKYFPVNGVESSFEMFEDDRMSTRSLQENAYAIVKFAGKTDENQIVINLTNQGAYPEAPAIKKVTFEIANVDARPAMVTINGKKVKSRYDKNTKTLTVTFDWSVSTPATLEITKGK